MYCWAQLSLVRSSFLLCHKPWIAVDVGFNFYDRISEERKTRNEAILNSRPTQELTEGPVEDLAKFVEEQRKKYYLWRKL